jgi:hypothetical protein
MVRLNNTTTRKVGVVGAVAASVAGLVLAAAPASAAVAAYPTSSFSIIYGASYYKGTVTWMNRSVSVTGAFKATGCRRVYAEAYAGSTWEDWQSSSTWCDRAGTATLPLSADVAGGASKVNVWMTTENASEGLQYFVCYRDESTCFGPYAGLPPVG